MQREKNLSWARLPYVLICGCKEISASRFQIVYCIQQKKSNQKRPIYLTLYSKAILKHQKVQSFIKHGIFRVALLGLAKVRQMIWTPLRTMGGVISGRGQPSRKILAPARIFFEPDRKLMPAPSEIKKNIVLAFLKAA